jgi:hypothetical protein
MSFSQGRVASTIALAIVIAVSAWLLLVALATYAGRIDGEKGLGWTFAAVLSAVASLKAMFVSLEVILVTGLAAIGGSRSSGKLAYAACAALVLGLIAILAIQLMYNDPDFASLIRGTTDFTNIDTFDEFQTAKTDFATWAAIGLSSGLAALLGMRYAQGQKDK